MINYTCNTPHPLKREGTGQAERFPLALGKDPATGKEYLQIDERSLTDLLKQSAAFARYVRYYNEQNHQDGDWQPFFEELCRYNGDGTISLNYTSWEELEKRSTVNPHLGLFLTFLKLIEISGNNLNTLRDKHLDFFYKTVLQIKPAPSVPDKVAVLFELEKNQVAVKVPEGTVLKAGKDKTGKELYYKTTADLVVNKAKVAEVKTVFAEKAADGVVQRLYASPDAPVLNIIGNNALKSWRTFGHASEPQLSTVGFAIASPMFNLRDGKRRISLRIPGIESLNRQCLRAEYTSEKGWTACPIDDIPGINSNATPEAKANLLVRIANGLPPMTPYNDKVHKAGMSTIHPVLRICVDNSTAAHYTAGYALLRKINVSNIDVTVTVAGIKNLMLQNDLGTLDPMKAFAPFGPQPVKHKSTLYIGNYTIFNKYLSSFHVSINWKGVPGKLLEYYSGYEKIDRSLFADFNDQWLDFEQGHPPGKLSVLDNGKWEGITLNDRANYQPSDPPKADTTNTYKPHKPLTSEYAYGEPQYFNADTRWGFAKIELGYDFGHRYYPKLVADAAIAKKPLPNPPYTPEFNSLHLDYVAKGKVELTKNAEHQFFHIHPFGYARMSEANSTLIPAYDDEGNLLIGLSGVTGPQVVSIYFQLHNDSGNPDKPLNDTNRISWYILARNTWVKLNEISDIISNTTINFTSTGFIKFVIPASAVSPHTVLTDGLTWIRASVAVNSDAYPNTLGIFTQAAEAVFDNRDNDPLHLQTPLAAGSITKLENSISGIKSVSQPYASYDGRVSEKAENFYTRVSERLRHKQRAWSIWDYERLVLEKFPQAFRVKCISHASGIAEYAIGQVLLVVLSNPANVNFQDPLKPRVSRSVIEEIKTYIRKFMSPFAQVEVVNPHYEALRVECDIKLKAAFNDESFYSNQLKTDLTGFIAPWTVNARARISFGGKIFKSQIINFIEERPYIDYVTRFEVYKGNTGEKYGETITGFNESSILTSVASQHHIINTNAVC